MPDHSGIVSDSPDRLIVLVPRASYSYHLQRYPIRSYPGNFLSTFNTVPRGLNSILDDDREINTWQGNLESAYVMQSIAISIEITRHDPTSNLVLIGYVSIPHNKGKEVGAARQGGVAIS